MKTDPTIKSLTEWDWITMQLKTWPIHLMLSVIGYFFLVGVGVLLGYPIISSSSVAFLMMLGFATGLEVGQNQIKAEHEPLTVRDVGDTFLDLFSWIVLPAAFAIHFAG